MFIFICVFKKANYSVNSGKEFLKFLVKNLEKKNISTKLELDRIAKFIINEDGSVEGNQTINFTAEVGEMLPKIKRSSKFLIKNITPTVSIILPSKIYRQITPLSRWTYPPKRKIELPAQAGLYWSNPNFDVNPAVFVRSSMAIPLFFRAGYPTD